MLIIIYVFFSLNPYHLLDRGFFMRFKNLIPEGILYLNMRELNLRENKKYTITTSENFQRYHKEISGKNKVDYLSKSEELELFEKIKQGDIRAREKVILSNLPLVLSVANKHNGNGIDHDDLVSEGNLGLIMAIDRFDPSYGYRFSTIAVNYIRGKILDLLTTCSKTVKISGSKVHQLSAVKKIQDRLEPILERIPTNQEIADYAITNDLIKRPGPKSPLDADCIADLLASDNETSSLDFCPNDDASLEELIASDPIVKDTIDSDIISSELESALYQLDAESRDMVMLYYGFDRNEPIKQTAIAEQMGVSTNLVNSKIREALKKLYKNKVLKKIIVEIS
jgi:RNA polymerase primary sigma factor